MLIDVNFSGQAYECSFRQLVGDIRLVEPNGFYGSALVLDDGRGDGHSSWKNPPDGYFYHFAPDVYFLSGFYFGYWSSFRVVLIADGKMPEQVFDGLNAELV